MQCKTKIKSGQNETRIEIWANGSGLDNGYFEQNMNNMR